MVSWSLQEPDKLYEGSLKVQYTYRIGGIMQNQLCIWDHYITIYVIRCQLPGKVRAIRCLDGDFMTHISFESHSLLRNKICGHVAFILIWLSQKI